MNKEDLDETRVMPKQDMGDTMELPAVHGNVRRLTPEQPQPDRPQGQPPKPGFWTTKRKRAALLVGGFVVMLFLGFMAAGYHQAKNLEAEQQRIEQQQLKENQEKMAGEVNDLQRQKADLQRQIRELEARQAELEKEQKKNAVERFFDKVTGKSGSIGVTGAKGSDAAALQQKVDAAKSQADAIDQKIDTAKAVGQQASEVKEKAVETYKQNEGVINEALGYAKAGAQALFNMLK